MDGGDEHAAGVNAHHLPGRQVRNGDQCLAHQLLGLIGVVDAAEDHPVGAGAVVQDEFQQLFALGHGRAFLHLHCPEVGPAEGLEIHEVGEQRLDLHLGKIDSRRGRLHLGGAGLGRVRRLLLFLRALGLHCGEQFTVCFILSYHTLLPHISHENQDFFATFAFVLFYLVIVKCGKICGNFLDCNHHAPNGATLYIIHTLLPYVK